MFSNNNTGRKKKKFDNHGALIDAQVQYDTNGKGVHNSQSPHKNNSISLGSDAEAKRLDQ